MYMASLLTGQADFRTFFLVCTNFRPAYRGGRLVGGGVRHVGNGIVSSKNNREDSVQL